METTDLIKQMHGEHASWQNKIQSFRTEIKLLNQDLSGIVSKYVPREVPAKSEHFQNSFILQNEVLDIMRHDFKQYENLLDANIEKPGKNEIGSILQEHQQHLSRLQDFEKLFKELKDEFNLFTKKEVQVS
ncbi:MAG: hypothetical protein IPP71_00615 [Bacteroidetes bacterium]|nr:hypothetical protein [Bacteroidota bacterium]